MMLRFLLRALLLTAVFHAPASAETSTTVSIRIAAASDLRFALEETLISFRALHPALGVDATYGSSGNFFAQVREGAPFDIFLSASPASPPTPISAAASSASA